MRDELVAVNAAFATPRKTEIVDVDFEVEDEDLIQREDMVVTVTHQGYIKRVPLNAYRVQRPRRPRPRCDGDEGRRLGDEPVRRLDPSAAAVLLVRSAWPMC